MTSGEPPRTSGRWRMMALALFVVLGISLSFMLVRAWKAEQANRQSHFNHMAASGAATLQRSLQEYREVLYGISALFTASPQAFTREAFRELTKGPLRRYPGLEALGWVPRIPEAERAAYLAAARREGIADLQITEWTPQLQMARAMRRDIYYPTTYIEPLESHGAAVGFNLASVPAYMEAMQKAISSEEAVASAWRALAQDAGEQLGFLLFVPIYKSGKPHNTFEERRLTLQGFTMATIRLSTLVEKALQDVALHTIGLELSDVTDAASKSLLALQIDATRTSSWLFLPRQATKAEAIREDIHWETTFHVAGRTWSLLAYPLESVPQATLGQSWNLLLGGLLLLCIISAGVVVLKQRR